MAVISEICPEFRDIFLAFDVSERCAKAEHVRVI